jgi:hypothetical protein
VPILERFGDHADRGAGDHELADLTGEMTAMRVAAHRLLQARVDARQHHRLVVFAARERRRRQHGGKPGRGARH